MERETTPSQSEWLIMEVFWANDTPTMTAKEVIKKNAGQVRYVIKNGACPAEPFVAERRFKLYRR